MSDQEVGIRPTGSSACGKVSIRIVRCGVPKPCIKQLDIHSLLSSEEHKDPEDEQS